LTEDTTVDKHVVTKEKVLQKQLAFEAQTFFEDKKIAYISVSY